MTKKQTTHCWLCGRIIPNNRRYCKSCSKKGGAKQ